MTAAIGKYAFEKMLGKHVNKQKNKILGEQQDPKSVHFITTINRRGKEKRIEKPYPDFLSKKDAQVFKDVRDRAFLLDYGISKRAGVGLCAPIGLIPELGDVINFILALQLYYECGKIEGGLPLRERWAMSKNIAFEFAVGLLPFIGAFIDAAYKSNSRNVAVLEAYLIEQYNDEVKKFNDQRTIKHDLTPAREASPSYHQTTRRTNLQHDDVTSRKKGRRVMLDSIKRRAQN